MFFFFKFFQRFISYDDVEYPSQAKNWKYLPYKDQTEVSHMVDVPGNVFKINRSYWELKFKVNSK